MGPVKGDCRNGRRGIGADAGKGAERLLRIGEFSIPVADNLDGAGMEVAGPGIIAKARPGAQHIFLAGLGQIGNLRPA